ncbi:MAG: hypothetical protein LBI10_00250 [Deltaproteobacteria bacterium]|jgi:hypothetical protein|nr:hypothetical protein [Deltaproteobacteria bacterium]
MLEILALFILVSKNAKNAISRGRKPGLFIFLTFLFWFGLELLVAVIAYVATNGQQLPTYLFALMGGLSGGVISYFIAKNCSKGQVGLKLATISGGPSLAAPVTLTIAREKAFVAALANFNVYFNGQLAGVLKNGQSLNVTVTMENNVVQILSDLGSGHKPLFFKVSAKSSPLKVVFGPTKFLLNQCQGLTPLSGAEAASYSQETTVTPGSEPVISLSKTSDFPDSQGDQKAKDAKGQNPYFAFWLLSISLILFILSYIRVECNDFCSINDASLYICLYSFDLGILIYLVIQEQLIYRNIGIIYFIFKTLIGAIFAKYSIVLFLIDLFIIGGAFIVGRIVKGSLWRKFSLSSLVAMGVYFISSIVYLTMLAINHGGLNFVSRNAFSFFGRCLSIAMVGVFAYLIFYFCEPRKAFLKTGIGGKIWFCLVTTGSLFGLIYGLYSHSLSLGLVAVTIFLVVGYIALILSKSFGWPLVLLAIILSCYARIQTIFIERLENIPLFLAGMAGLLILWFTTWLCVHQGWRNCRTFDLQDPVND